MKDVPQENQSTNDAANKPEEPKDTTEQKVDQVTDAAPENVEQAKETSAPSADAAPEVSNAVSKNENNCLESIKNNVLLGC